MGVVFEESGSGLIVCLGLGLRHLMGVTSGALGEGRGRGHTGDAEEMFEGLGVFLTCGTVLGRFSKACCARNVTQLISPILRLRF